MNNKKEKEQPDRSGFASRPRDEGKPWVFPHKRSAKVYVGLSGGVDSSVSAALLKQQGYDVTGVYMKNWSRDLPGMKCPWAEDLADAKRVAVRLGIDFKVFDFEKEYKHKVVDYMIKEYEAGRTPNPDVMCNQEVKFKLFLDTALENGADFIATGHYAQVGVGHCCDDAFSASLVRSKRSEPSSIPMVTTGDPTTWSAPLALHASKMNQEKIIARAPKLARAARVARLGGPPQKESHVTADFFVGEDGETGPGRHKDEQIVSLLRAVDENKDQTYFLYRVTREALAKTLFPIGHLTKPQVRELAKKFNLPTAAKKDSQGICFVGSVGIRDFLSEFVKTCPGEIIEKETGKVLGLHDGAIFYTFGQRHGLDVGGGLPYYVVGKDMAKNEVYVSTDLNNDGFWKKDAELTDLHWINNAPAANKTYKVRVRHRAPLIDATLNNNVVTFTTPERAVASGQSVVFYAGEICLGGGIVA